MQVTFTGCRLEVHSKVARGTTDLRKMSISYIDLDLGREERRQLLRTHFHFDCQCSLCVGEEVEAPQHLVDLSKLQHSVASAAQVDQATLHQARREEVVRRGPCWPASGAPGSVEGAACPYRPPPAPTVGRW